MDSAYDNFDAYDDEENNPNGILHYYPCGKPTSIVGDVVFKSGMDNDMLAVYVTLKSLPNSWDYSAKGLATMRSCGRDRILKAIKRLEEAGYVARMQKRESGKWASTVPVVVDAPEHLPGAIGRYRKRGYKLISEIHAQKPQVSTVNGISVDGADLGIVENSTATRAPEPKTLPKPQVNTVNGISVHGGTVYGEHGPLYKSVSDIENKSISESGDDPATAENPNLNSLIENAPKGAETEAESRKPTSKTTYRSFPAGLRADFEELESRFANPCQTESARAEAIAAYANIRAKRSAQDVLDAHALYARSCEERGREARFTMSPLSWLTKEEKADWFDACMRRVDAARAAEEAKAAKKARSEESRRAARRADADRERREAEARSREAAEMRAANEALEGLDPEAEARLALAFAGTPEGAGLSERAETVRAEMRAAATAGVADPKASSCKSYGLMRSMLRCPAYNARFARFVKEGSRCES